VARTTASTRIRVLGGRTREQFALALEIHVRWYTCAHTAVFEFVFVFVFEPISMSLSMSLFPKSPSTRWQHIEKEAHVSKIDKAKGYRCLLIMCNILNLSTRSPASSINNSSRSSRTLPGARVWIRMGLVIGCG